MGLFGNLFKSEFEKWVEGASHGTSFVDGFARVASTKEKAIGTAIGTVGGLGSGMK